MADLAANTLNPSSSFQYISINFQEPQQMAEAVQRYQLDFYQDRISNLNYKTIRYPGHCEKMLFLMSDLKLSQDRETLKKILLNVLPHTQQDVVIVDVSVEGFQNNQLIEESYYRKFYPTYFNGHHLSAIQSITAGSACAVVDLVLQNPKKYRGFVHQWQFLLHEFLAHASRFAPLFAELKIDR